MSCAVCAASPDRPKLRVGGVQIRECPRCGLAWWAPPAGFDARSVYDAGYFDGAGQPHGYDDYAALEPALRASFARRLAQLPQPRAGARLLDVGAAFGFGVAAAQRAGWGALGVEVSPAAARRAAQSAPGRLVVGSALRLPFATASLDAVTLWDVLEHLPEPHAAAAEIARVLLPGGRLALTTGDVGSPLARLSGARWHLYTLPEHLFFFSRKSLRLLLEAHGLRVESLRAAGSWYTLGYVVERLRKTLLGSRAPGAARVPGAGLRLPLNLYDIVLLRAVRS